MNEHDNAEVSRGKKAAYVKWSHAVNSQSALAEYTANPAIDYIEGDIRVAPDGSIIMAHPPENISDLTFDQWIEAVIKSGKAAKLDFKDWGTIEYALTKLQDRDSQSPIMTPIMLNADILIGPGGAIPNVLKKDGHTDEKPQLADAHDFVQMCQSYFPRGVLSLGWTTSADESPYTQEHIDEMKTLIIDNVDLITFPVRICKGPRSIELLRQLIDYQHPGKHTLSWWNNEDVSDDQRLFLQHLKATESEHHFIDIINPVTKTPETL